jgi:glycosyltransferase involved in cell wall biosynthesis
MGEQIRFLHEVGDGVVFLSEKYIPQAMQMSGISSTDKFFFAGNPNTYEESEIKTAEKENTLLFVGRLSVEKRPEKAMKLWENIQHQYPDWNMKIVGGGVLVNELVYLKDKMKLERFSLEGYKDPTSYYEKSKILLVPSDFEGFGMSILEAQQHGIVPFTFRTYDALSDVMIDNETGIGVKPYDLKEFEAKLTNLMNEPEQLYKMSQAGKILSKQFSLPYIIKQWEDIFEKIGMNNASLPKN